MDRQKLRALIVDDEPLARERLRTLLEEDPEVEIAGECADGRSAVEAVLSLGPDLVFLDVQMAELDGFGVVAEVGAARMPPVIFVTAFDEYAIRAFDVHALDYLLKPFDRARFLRALSRAKKELADPNAPLREQLKALLEDVRPELRRADPLVIKSRGRITFLRLGDVDWIEAAGNYVRIHAGQDSHLMRETMARMVERLPPEEFVRVSRSAIVRIDRIKELRPLLHGDSMIVLRDGTKVRSSRSYSDRLAEVLGH